MLRYCLADHCGYVRKKKLDKATGVHLNLPGQSLTDLSITVLEKARKNNHPYRREREKYHIKRFDTFYKDINMQK